MWQNGPREARGNGVLADRHEGKGHMGDTEGESGAEKGEVGYGERGYEGGSYGCRKGNERG